MENINIIVTFLSGLGFGSVVTLLIKHSLDQKAKLKEVWLMDYKQTCDNLLDAYREVSFSNSEKARKAFAFHELKIKLYANEKVVSAIDKFKNSEPNSAERKDTELKMLEAMRSDLGLV